MNRNLRLRVLLASLLILLMAPAALAQEEMTVAPPEEEQGPSLTEEALENSFLKDYNGDGNLVIVAFGDSITRGTGDFIGPNQFIESTSNPSVEAGYPLRIESILGLPVQNFGDPGEVSIDGASRFARSVPAARPDIVIISEGSNDAIFNTSATVVNRDIQTMVNISYAIGAQPVVVSLTPTCCDRSGRNPSIQSYSDQIRSIASSNSIPLADVDRAFENTCGAPSRCSLLNRPEGLHPNIEGHDVIGENVIAALLGINLLAPEGPAAYEMALNLPEGSVRTVPDAPAEE